MGLWATNDLHLVHPTAALHCRVRRPQAPSNHITDVYSTSSKLLALAVDKVLSIRPAIVVIDPPCQQHLTGYFPVSRRLWTTSYGRDRRFIAAGLLLGAIPWWCAAPKGPRPSIVTSKPL